MSKPLPGSSAGFCFLQTAGLVVPESSLHLVLYESLLYLRLFFDALFIFLFYYFAYSRTEGPSESGWFQDPPEA